MIEKFDAAVIGGGPGGYVAAIRLAQLGKKVALIEKDKLGGTCLNRGCIPTKSLLHSAEVYETVRKAKEYGITAENVSYDYAKVAQKKDAVVKKLRQGIAHLEKKAGVEVISAQAAFKDKNTILAGGRELKADNIIIATGSMPASVPIPGIDSVDGVINSDGALALTKLPQSVVIIGGGVIGIEFATLYAAFGIKVAVVEMMPQILPTVDTEIAGMLRKTLEKKGVGIYTGAKVERIEDGVSVHFDQNGKKSVTCEMCIVAVGRKPVKDGLGIEALGINQNKGFVTVDERMRTNIPGIWAIGDVTGGMQLAHAASAQGLVAAHNIAGEKKTYRGDIIPSCVYCEPEIACVGLSEKQAKDKGLDIRIGRFDAAGNGRSMIMGAAHGLVKLVTEARTGEILGCHIMAPRATDMIGEVCAAMRAEGTIDELIDTVHAHPTVSEMIMEAAHDTEGLCVHK